MYLREVFVLLSVQDLFPRLSAPEEHRKQNVRRGFYLRVPLKKMLSLWPLARGRHFLSAGIAFAFWYSRSGSCYRGRGVKVYTSDAQ
jgi:hypothetical protein